MSRRPGYTWFERMRRRAVVMEWVSRYGLACPGLPESEDPASPSSEVLAAVSGSRPSSCPRWIREWCARREVPRVQLETALRMNGGRRKCGSCTPSRPVSTPEEKLRFRARNAGIGRRTPMKSKNLRKAARKAEQRRKVGLWAVFR